MKRFLFLSLLGALTRPGWAHEISSDAFKTSEIPFLSHQGPGPFDTYLTMELPYAPYESLRKQLEAKVGPLKHRGEAHITVITPPEYDKVLRPAGVTIDEIEAIARKEKIQDSEYELVCLAKGEVKEKNKTLRTYFVVMQSKALDKIREKVSELYRKKGGDPEKFHPEWFWSHITLGFTERDLHESDGVIKTAQSCLEDGKISVIP